MKLVTETWKVSVTSLERHKENLHGGLGEQTENVVMGDYKSVGKTRREYKLKWIWKDKLHMELGNSIMVDT